MWLPERRGFGGVRRDGGKLGGGGGFEVGRELTVFLIGECKSIVGAYLRCVRRMRGTNDTECRMIAKEYLRCRMDR